MSSPIPRVFPMLLVGGGLLLGSAAGPVEALQEPTRNAAPDGLSNRLVPEILDPSGPLYEPQIPGEITDISPGGAFLRSLLVPGWGHAATGSHFRGAFYLAAQSGAWWMLSKSIMGRNEARRFRSVEVRAVEDRARASGVVRPDSIRVMVNADEGVQQWEELIERRGEQVEDWAALVIFTTLLAATDAFVAGHLMDPPEPLSFIAAPRLDGRWEVGLRVRAQRLPGPR